MELTRVYTKFIFQDTDLKSRNSLIYTLNLLSYAQYLKNLTKDKRSLFQLAQIIKEEYKL